MAESDELNRRNELEAEMSRFEQEIAENPVARPVIATNTFRMASKAIENAPKPTAQEHQASHFTPRPLLQSSNVPPHNVQTPLVQGPLNRLPPPMQVQMQHPVHGPPNQLRPPPMPQNMNPPPGVPQMVPQMVSNQTLQVGPVMRPVNMPMVSVPMPVGLPVAGTVPTSVPVMTAEEQREWESTYTQGASEVKEKKKKEKKFVRVAGDTVWEDNSLAEWEQDDFRVFCGDLGNEVTDEILTRTFAKYPSLLKAKVVRDKKTNKSKGYGFLSFKDPNDFAKAMREMNGKYVGNRPIKLRKSTWKDRNIEIAKKKQKEKKRLGYR
ncbi:RNA-binding protein 42 [Acropora cervicornis]|uniref:RNA-binding protein 42 n=1 Tax=Acropora cervicornis TaxID=6130 RepID=A0AAD9R6C0_ACRCE|nr:RNA-binding protein 42 [Acropora cervicornis]